MTFLDMTVKGLHRRATGTKGFKVLQPEAVYRPLALLPYLIFPGCNKHKGCKIPFPLPTVNIIYIFLSSLETGMKVGVYPAAGYYTDISREYTVRANFHLSAGILELVSKHNLTQGMYSGISSLQP